MLGADRIDRGVRAIEDPELVALLVDRRIPLGVCPTSNLKLRIYAAIEEHPIDRLRRAGVVVSINTDDPVLLGASLEGEYALCSRAFGWSDEDLRSLAQRAGRHRLAYPLNPCKGDILAGFWGDAVEIDDGARMTWMRQPHYYLGLYPYTYSVDLLAASAMAGLVAYDGPPAVQRWLQVLQVAGST